MSEPPEPKPPKHFDLIKWSFFLVAGVITAHIFLVSIIVIWCLFDYENLVAAGRQCDPEGKLTEILAAALAAALAFAGGKMRDK